MKKPLVEFSDKTLNTVEDMIEALMDVPKGYTLHPLGQQCAVAIDHYNGCIYLDEPKIMDDLKYDTECDAKYNGDNTEEVEVPDDKLVTYKEYLKDLVDKEPL